MSENPTDPTQNPPGEDTTRAPDGNPPGRPFTDPDDLPPGDPALEDPQRRPRPDGLPAEPSEDDSGASTLRGGEDASAADADRG